MTFLALVGLGCAASHAVANDSQVLFKEDFEDSRSPIARKLEKSPLVEMVGESGVSRSRGLIAAYKGYREGSRRMTLRWPLASRAAEATLCYDVMFPADFQFVRGGKLHGLGPDKPVTGGKPMTPGGWSARVNFTEAGGVAAYLYTQDKAVLYGQRIKSEGFRFAPGEFHAVSLHVGLNSSPAKADGFAVVYVDGRKVVEQRGVRFRACDNEESLISKFLFSTFHGGHSEEYAPRTEDGEFATVRAFFDNFAVHEGKHIRAAAGRP